MNIIIEVEVPNQGTLTAAYTRDDSEAFAGPASRLFISDEITGTQVNLPTEDFIIFLAQFFQSIQQGNRVQ